MKKRNSLLEKKNKPNFQSDEEKFPSENNDSYDDGNFTKEISKIDLSPAKILTSENNQNKKYRINYNNISRLKNEKILEDLHEDFITSSHPKINDERTHIIVISRKRNRISNDEDSDNEFSHLSWKKQKIADENIHTNHSYFENQNVCNSFFPIKSHIISPENELNDCIPNLIDELTLDPVDKDLIKNRNIKSFAKQELRCQLCNSNEKDEDYFYTNFYPQLNFNENDIRAPKSSLNKLSSQLAEIRQMKLKQKRGIEIRFEKKSDFKEMENLYRKLYGDKEIIKITNDKIAILCHNNSELEKDLNISSLKKNTDLSYYIMQVETDKIKFPNYIEECINNYEKNNVLANDSPQSDNFQNDDSDSNREDNPNNDYPDEESDNGDDEYEIYNTHNKNSYTTYLREAEKRLNERFIEINQDIIMGYNCYPDVKNKPNDY